MRNAGTVSSQCINRPRVNGIVHTHISVSQYWKRPLYARNARAMKQKSRGVQRDHVAVRGLIGMREKRRTKEEVEVVRRAIVSAVPQMPSGRYKSRYIAKFVTERTNVRVSSKDVGRHIMLCDNVSIFNRSNHAFTYEIK